MPTHENYLIIRGDGEDLLALDPDPRYLLAPPARRAALLLTAILAVLSTTAAAWAAYRDLSAEPGSADDLSNDLAILLLVLAGALWVGFFFSLSGRRRRQDLVDAYAGLAHESPSPRLATVTSVDYSANEHDTIVRCTLRVELAEGTRLAAVLPRRRAAADASLRSLLRKTPQLPRFGDTVAVFRGSELTVVQANHSWSGLHHRAPSEPSAS